jgi:hypothetical protein
MTARRDWFAVYCRLPRTPKFARLNDAAKLTLLYTWALAGDETPEATWPSLDALAAILALYGRSRESLDSLVSAGWLEVDDSRVMVHDWDAHQLAATTEARRVYEADRKAEWRRRNAPPTPPFDRTSQDKTGVPKRPGHVRDMSGTPPRQNGGPPPEARTCPGCGDLLDDPKDDPNVVVVDRLGRLGHRVCPGLTPEGTVS